MAISFLGSSKEPWNSTKIWIIFEITDVVCRQAYKCPLRVWQHRRHLLVEERWDWKFRLVIIQVWAWVPIMAYAQPHPRLSVLSYSSQSSLDHLSPTTTSTRFSLPSASPSHTAVASTKPGLNRPNIYDRNLNKTRSAEVSGAAYAFLFSEIVQYTQKRVSDINDLERQWVAYDVEFTSSELHED